SVTAAGTRLYRVLADDGAATSRDHPPRPLDAPGVGGAWKDPPNGQGRGCAARAAARGSPGAAGTGRGPRPADVADREAARGARRTPARRRHARAAALAVA